MITDYFALEPLIIARIKAEVPELLEVAGNSDRDFEDSSYLPSAILVHDGCSPVTRSGTSQTIDQRWVVVILVSSPNDASGSKARAEAGTLMIKIKNALVGWEPMPFTNKLSLAPSESETYTEAGIAIFPIGFTSRIII